MLRAAVATAAATAAEGLCRWCLEARRRRRRRLYIIIIDIIRTITPSSSSSGASRFCTGPTVNTR